MNVQQADYIEFLKSKICVAPETGFEITDRDVNSILKPHQRDAVIWAVKGGRRALFESFGLGKTIQQLEIIRIILEKEGGKGLIICPLGVRQEFKHDAEVLLNHPIKYVKTQAECDESEENILITNYERVRDGDIKPDYFTVTSLDEASVLRSYGSKTYQQFLNQFQDVKYKYVCTATPSPNKYKELIHYAGYLGIMDTGQALTRFFQRDSQKANNLTLYPHKEEEFWLWMSTWALYITKPSDLGYDDTGYDLPPMDVQYHEVKVDHNTAGAEQDGQVKMFRDAALGLKDASKEKRDSVPARVNKAMEIINADPDSHYIIWHDLEYERHAVKKALPEAVEVYGSQDLDKREHRIVDFSHGRIKYLATKPVISGSGCNFQRYCHKAIFLGIGYKFNNFIQAIHRIYRFLQTEKVQIHIIYTESEAAILDTLREKWHKHNYMVEKMIGLIRKYGLSNTNVLDKLARTIGINRGVAEGERFTAINNDSVLECQAMEDNSIDLIHTSIPFSNHYEYTPSYNDFGHNEDNDKFFEQMDYLTPELLRILKPGRVCAIHVKDRILFGNATGTGMPTVDPFSDITTAHFRKHGFQFFGRITIVTDVVRENNQTYRLGWTECTKDGSKMGVGCPEYILLFRKLPTDTTKAYADTPVVKSKGTEKKKCPSCETEYTLKQFETLKKRKFVDEGQDEHIFYICEKCGQESHATEWRRNSRNSNLDIYTRAQWQIDAHAFWRSSGDRILTVEDLQEMPVDELQKVYRQFSRENVYSYRDHVNLAKNLDKDGHLPSTFMVVAPGSWHENVWDDVNRMWTLNSNQSQKQKNNHICPLQFDIVERIINRFSNPEETVLDPFGGLMTVPYMAVKINRKGIGIELNYDYWKDGCWYLEAIEQQVAAPTLFDLVGMNA